MVTLKEWGRWRLALVVLILTVMAGSAAVGADEAADHDAFRKIKALYEEGVNSGDLSKFAPFLDSKFTAVVGTGDVIHGADELQAYWKKIYGLIGAGGTYHAKIKPDPTEFFGDFAVAHGTTDEQVRTGSGQEYAFQSFWTVVGRRDGDSWKVIRAHGSMNPITNPFIERQVAAARLMFGIGGVVLGALVLLVILRIVNKRQRV